MLRAFERYRFVLPKEVDGEKSIAFPTYVWYNRYTKEVALVSEIERIVKEVDGSMAMEGLPLNNADKDRIRKCLMEPDSLDSVIRALISKHTVPARMRK